MITNQSLVDRFFRYVKIDTQSQEDAERHPSTDKQFDLARLLCEELREMGAEAELDEEHCYVYAAVPGEEPALGFVAHVDTSPAVSGAGVVPRIIENYDGSDEMLNPEVFPELREHFGEDLIAASGETLLGADDKAGVAEIMELVRYVLAHPEKPHRAIRVAFTPDEEVGEGTAFFDPARFGAKEAYTIDGGKLGEIEYECFNAASAKVKICGRSVHPGDAKNRMVNACSVAVEFAGLLPAWETPEHTEGYEGFFHLGDMTGSVDEAEMRYIVRDHDRALFEARKETMLRTAEFLNSRYGEGTVSVELRDQYFNMAEVLRDDMTLVERAKEAFHKVGAEPLVKPIRGGTDGAALSFMGIPCPNLSTGGGNFHGRYEYASVQEMEKMVQVLIALAEA